MAQIKSLTFNDPLLQNTLWTGRLQTENGEKVAILQAIHEGAEKQFVFELKELNQIALPHFFKRFLIAIRVFSLTATATPGLVVLGAGIIFEKKQADFPIFFASLLSVIFLQISVNVLNDVEDHVKGIDRPGDIGGSGVIQKAWFSAQSVSRMGAASFFVACVLGIIPLLHYPKELLVIGVLALLGGMGYSGFGIGLKYRALGDLSVFLLCGPLLCMGFSIATFGILSPLILITGSIFGLASVAILHANNLNDLEIDAERGAKTVANQIGFKWSQKYLALIYLGLYLICMISALLMPKSAVFLMAPILVLPIVIKMLQKVKTASGPLSPALALIRFDAAKIHLLIGFSWLLVFLVKIIF